MAGFQLELPTEVIGSFNKLHDNADEMFTEMTKAGAKVVFNNIKDNMKKSFKTTRTLEKGLKITKSYHTKSDDAVNTKVGFYGYDDDGVAIPLKALAREYGTSRGEKKKPFLRKSFKTESTITDAMLKVQERYIGNE